MTISLWTSFHAPISRGWRRNLSGYVWVQLYCLSLTGPCFGACLYNLALLSGGPIEREKIKITLAGKLSW